MYEELIFPLSENLEAAYNAGEIVVTDGVARNTVSNTIVAHLEQVAPYIGDALEIANPYITFAKIAFRGVQAFNAHKQKVVNDAKLNHIIHLTQQIQSLSTVNLAISSVTLGVGVSGLALVLNKINKIDRKLDELSKKNEALDAKFFKVQ